MKSPPQRVCAVCQTTTGLMPHPSGALVCLRGDCRAELTRRQHNRSGEIQSPGAKHGLTLAAQHEAQKLAELSANKRAEDAAMRDQKLAARRDIDPQTFPLLPLPSCRREITPLPEERRQHFRELLVERIARALEEFRELEGREEPLPINEPEPLPHSAIVGHACTLCGGACCVTGGDHAHLTDATLLRVLRLNPGWDAEQVLDAYLSSLPERSHSASCIYHGPAGCTLPHELRASACHFFFCDGVKQLRARIDVQQAPQSAFAVVRSREQWDSPASPDNRISGTFLLNEDGAEAI